MDGELDETNREAVSAHVSRCAECAAVARGLRAYRERMGCLRTAPAALPPQFRTDLSAALDRVDRGREATKPGRHASQSLPLGRRAAVALVLLLLTPLMWATVSALRPGPRILLAALPVKPTTTAAGTNGFLATDDVDRAATWVGERLGAATTPVNLTLLGATCVGAAADRGLRRGTFFYRTAAGQPLALHVLLVRNPQLPGLPTVRFEGAPFRIAQASGTAPNGAVWQAEGRTFVALGRVPVPELLRYAREMDRHCRERR